MRFGQVLLTTIVFVLHVACTDDDSKQSTTRDDQAEPDAARERTEVASDAGARGDVPSANPTRGADASDGTATDAGRKKPTGRTTAPSNAGELLAGQFAAPSGSPSAPPDTIAYVTFNGALRGRSQVRLIQSDGSDDRLLFEVDPEKISEFYRPAELVWNPNATELAFTSGHLDASYFVRDVYAVTVDAKNLRRITNPPLSDRLQAYPSGGVELDVYPFTGTSSRWWAYIEGAPEAVTWLDPGRWEIYNVSFDDVADFGEREQFVVVRDLSEMSGIVPWCSYAQAGKVDVVAGKSSRVPAQLPESGRSAQPCAYAEKPQWSRDGKQLTYLVTDNEVRYTNYELWSAPALDGRPGERGRRTGSLANQEETLRVFSLDPSSDERFAMMVDGPGGLFQRVFLGSATDPSTVTEIPDAVLCAPDAISDCAYPMLVWQPDGSGFYYVVRVDENADDPHLKESCGGASPCNELRFFDVEQRTFKREALFVGKQLRSMSFAPDMRRLVMEVETAVSAIHDLWVHDLDSGASTLLVGGAASAVWAPKR